MQSPTAGEPHVAFAESPTTPVRVGPAVPHDDEVSAAKPRVDPIAADVERDTVPRIVAASSSSTALAHLATPDGHGRPPSVPRPRDARARFEDTHPPAIRARRAEPNAVKITIGRVEIVSPPASVAAETPSRAARRPAVSLSDYLDRRAGGAER